MIDKYVKLKYDNRGSALIMALVVSAVLMVLSLSLLAISYSFFLSQKKNTGDAYEREMFYSAIEVFEKELSEGGHKVWEEGTSQETVLAYPDDNLFGTKIVASIFKYHENQESQEMESGEIPSVDRTWPCYNPNYENSNENNSNGIYRFFKLTSLGAYELTVQMYWEYGNTENHSIDDIILHAIFRMKKDDETMMKNERVYRMGVNNGNTVESDSEIKDYYVKFAPISDSTENRISNEFFPNTEVDTNDKNYPCVYISEGEKNKNIFEKEGYEYLKKFKFYTKSSNGAMWNGVPQVLYDTWPGNNKDRTARYKWEGGVPVRIRFVINGYYVDYDIYDFCYLKTNSTNPTVVQKFTKTMLEEKLTNELLEACEIPITDTDNKDNIIWKYEYQNKYYDFFEGENPKIKSGHINNNKLEYNVYATFPSYYNTEAYDSFKSGVNIPPYDINKTISIGNVCNYTKYCFKRIIGE